MRTSKGAPRVNRGDATTSSLTPANPTPRSAPVEAKSRRRKTYLLTIAGLWISILAVLLVFRGVLLPFGAALLVAYVSAPLVARLSRMRVAGRRVPRWVAILAIYLGFFASVYVFSVAALPQLYREVVRISAEARDFVNGLTPERISSYTRIAEAWLDDRGIPVALGAAPPASTEALPAAPDAAALARGADVAPEGAKLHLDVASVVQKALGGITGFVQLHFLDLVGYSQQFVGGVLGGVFMLFFVLMVAAFLLLDTEGILAFVHRLVPIEWREDFAGLLQGVDEKLSGVVRGQIVICLVNGVLTLVGLLLLEVKFALVLAIVATVLSFIPIFGTILSTIPIVLVGLSQSFSTGVAALAWILGIHAVEAYFLNPKIMGESAKIHPALVAFALLAGERTFGFVGALFAVPVASIILATFHHFHARAERLQAEEAGDVLALEPAEAPKNEKAAG